MVALIFWRYLLKNIRLILFLFFVSLLSLSALAKTQVSANIEPRVVAPQSSFTLNVEIEYKSAQNIQPPRLPKLNNFYLINQKSGDHVFIINGEVTRKKIYSYRLQSGKEGKFQIGSMEVIVDGKMFKTAPLQVEVSSKAKSRRHSNPFGNIKRFMSPHFFNPNPGFFDDEDTQGAHPPQRGIREKDVLFQLEVKKDTVYLGEMMIAEWFIYVPRSYVQNINIIRSQIMEHAKLNDFWVEPITTPGKAPTLSPQSVEVNGKEYQKELVISSALFPIREGTLTIDSFKINSIVVGFSSFGFSKPISHISDEKQIKVLPLPKDGKGKFFTEAVGDFNISASINKKVASVREPVIYKVNFKGTGHPRLIRLPSLSFGDSFEIYDTTESQKFSFSESVKNFEVILIPQKTGDLVVPSFELSSFDPHLGIYKTHILPSFNLKIMGVDVPSSSADKSAIYFEPKTKKKDTETGQNFTEDESKDILIAPLAWDQKSKFLEYRRIFWLSIYGLLFLVFILSLIKFFLFQKDNTTFKKRLTANLEKVEHAIKSKNWKRAGIELNQLMYFFFSELSGQEKTAKNWDILLKNINPSIRVKYELKIKALVSRTEQLSFASFETTKTLRNRRNVEHLKKAIMDMIQEISTEYTL